MIRNKKWLLAYPNVWNFQVLYVRKHWKCSQLKGFNDFFLNIKTARSTTSKPDIMCLPYSFLIPPPDLNLEGEQKKKIKFIFKINRSCNN